jgi:hypothetical protein
MDFLFNLARRLYDRRQQAVVVLFRKECWVGGKLTWKPFQRECARQDILND